VGTDPVTGLIRGETFLQAADALLTQATRTAREVGLMSLFVDGTESADTDSLVGEHHNAFAAIGSALLDVRAQRDVVGRVGAREFSWMCVLSRGSELDGAVESLRTTVDANLGAAAVDYRVGATLAHGRRIGLDALIVEARTQRDAPPTMTSC